SEEFIARIFDKFSQEEDTTNRRFEGTGLGMAISNDLVKLMGSELKVLSIKDKGTTIQFELQLPKGNVANLYNAGVEIKKNKLKGTRVLLVEDNEMNRFIARQSLEYAGCTITEAENGQEAIGKLKEYNFDLILMDIQMPIMDGVEASIYIRNKLKLEVPIIAL
ncbi:Aerobic respiration control sensor ArcB-like protein, partial [Daphnia magna]